jgi:uncharacterized protein (DUF2141 family)
MKRFFSLLILLLAFSASSRAADLTVVVDGLRSEAGIVRVALFDSGGGFPMDTSRAVALQRLDLAVLPATHSKAIVFKNLPAKTYAVSVFHDEDADGKLKTNWLGMPREGVGASRNAKGRMGPPPFGAAAFLLTGNMRIVVSVIYL